jgi:hypothetical protein
MRMRGIVMAGTVALATAIGAAPASAVTINYYGSGDSVAMGTQDSVQTGCVTGKALGGGIFVTGAYNTARINTAGLNDGPDMDSKPDDAWIGFVDGLTGNTISANVACLQGAPGEALKYRTEEGIVGVGKTKSLVAECPKGYSVTGGDASNNAGFGDAALKGTLPIQKGTAWEGITKNIGAGPVHLRTIAICAKGGFARKLSYRSKKNTADAGQEESAEVGCAGNGKIIGGGVKVGKGSFVVNSVGMAGPDFSRSFVDATGANPVKFTSYGVCFK